MAGIFESSINKADPFSKIKGYEAERVDIAPEDTVESRVQRIIERGGKGQQQEVTRAKQEQARAGLLNTSMAVGAAEGARIQHALPIASQDSSQSLEARIANQLATGKASEFSAGEFNIAGQQERVGQQQLEQQELIGTQNIALAGEEARLISVRDELLAKEARGVALTKAETDALTAATAATEARGVAETKAETDTFVAEAAAKEARGVALTKAETDALTAATAAEEARVVAERKAEQDIILENLNAANTAELTKVQGEFNTTIQASAAAANIYQSHSANITEILNNPKIKPAQKQQLIAKEVELMRGALAIQESIIGMELTDILDFTGGETGGTPPIVGRYGPGGYGPGGV